MKEWFAAIVVCGIVGLVGWAVWFNWKHPCIQYQNYACEVTECTSHYPVVISNGHGGTNIHWMCGHYETRQTTCSRCVARKP